MNSKKSYKLEYDKALLMLDNISKLNIDVSALYDELKELDIDVISSSLNKGGFALQKDVYKSNLVFVKKFQKKLESYEVLFNIKNSTEYLSKFINKNLDKESVVKSSDEIIRSLEELKKCDGCYGSELESVINSLISLVYNVIKLEFIYIGDSKVLDYILKENMFIREINTFIVNEIEKLKISVNEIKGLDDLENIIFEKGKKGILAHYVSKDVFKALVVCTDYNKIEEYVINVLNNFKKQSKNIFDNLNQQKNEKVRIDSFTDATKSKMISSFKEIKRKIIAFVLTGSILGTGTYMLKDVIRLGATNKTYFTTTSTVTEEDGLLVESEEYIGKLEEQYSVKIDVSNIFVNGFMDDKLETHTYDVTDKVPQGTKEFQFDDFSYLDLRKKINIKTTEIFARRLTDEEKEEILKEYKYIIIEQDLEKMETDFSKFGYCFLYSLVGIVDIIIFSFICGVLFNIRELPDDLKTYFDSKKNIKMKKKQLIELLNKCRDYINSSEELKREFEKFCKENKLAKSFSNSEIINSDFKNIEDLKLKLGLKK